MKQHLGRILATAIFVIALSHSPESKAQQAGCPLQGEVIQSGAICAGALTGTSLGTTALVAQEGACASCFLAPTPVTCGACAIVVGVAATAMYTAGQYCAASAEELLTCHDEVEPQEPPPSESGSGGFVPIDDQVCTNQMSTFVEWVCNPTPTGVECRMEYHDFYHTTCF